MIKYVKYILLSGLLLVILVIIVELALGILFHFKDRGLEPMAIHDFPYLYYLFDSVPGLNVHGFKTAYPVEKKAGHFRIVLVGGSVARGREPEQSIAYYLEQKLNAAFHTNRIEVINAGMSAYVVEQEFLLIQLIVQHYEPDVIIGLDGYNDLLTVILNRRNRAEFELPPHHWEYLRFVETLQKENQRWRALSLLFSNINRAVQFLRQRQYERQFDWETFVREKSGAVSRRYWQIIDDTHAFCKAKGISYYSFFQPVRFAASPVNSDDRRRQALQVLYRTLEKGTHERNFAFSLADLLGNNPQWFLDDCHVTAAGHEKIAEAMAMRLGPEVEAWLEN
ncbi:MAG: hypothetical protein KatS3mg031_0849 [Chitinophagales bacterium]|nr:MAG: hypothetical protein KatS3mg031_0849 [Chitinophagales bacterium]